MKVKFRTNSEILAAIRENFIENKPLTIIWGDAIIKARSGSLGVTPITNCNSVLANQYDVEVLLDVTNVSVKWENE